jgi:hypothetical protein
MSPTYWGPSVWLFIHGLAATINNTGYEILKYQMYNIIHRIMFLLPCPECAQDSVKMLSLVKITTKTTKEDFINMLYLLHNQVNVKLKKPLFNSAYIPQYEQVDIIQCYNRFINVYSTTSIRLINDNMHRKMLVNQIKTWLIGNIQHFRNIPPPLFKSPVMYEEPSKYTTVSEEPSKYTTVSEEPEEPSKSTTVSEEPEEPSKSTTVSEDNQVQIDISLDEPVSISHTLQNNIDTPIWHTSNNNTQCIVETLTTSLGDDVHYPDSSSSVTPLVIKRKGRQKKTTIS